MEKALANAIRFLSIDMVEKAKSGHPGMPMGMADIALILFHEFLHFNPKDPKWFNRDRLILSNGHGSALLYSCLYLSGYEKMTLDELKNFRQLNSLTPGHPEYNIEAGIETTTGPLGQGIANGVGMALSERILNSRFGDELVNHKTYVFCGDGCLMEGISHEALSFAGHYKLKNLVILFDDNSITIDGPTSLSTSDNHIKRLNSYNWNTLSINGHNYDEIRKALKLAEQSDKPTFIACKTTIGFGAPNKAGSAKAHGSPLGEEEVKLSRQNLNWPYTQFEIPPDILNKWHDFYKRNLNDYKRWQDNFNKNSQLLKQYINKESLNKVSSHLKEIINESLKQSLKDEATRVSSGKILNELYKILPNLIGGSADLTPSNNTYVTDQNIISAENYSGSYLHYGIREHAMAAIMSGINLHGALISYGGTFLTFSDYARPAIRLSALMKLNNIYIMTHDSIGLGEDGPTHQPIEHLASLRAIPNLNVYRPADFIETVECWELALLSPNTPAVICLSRQPLTQIRNEESPINKCSNGGYIIREFQNDFKVSIFATGSELEIAMHTADLLEAKNIGTRIISVPCMDLLFKSEAEHIMMLTCNSSLKVAIEAGVNMGWEKLIGPHGIFIGMDSFGASAPHKDLYEYFGLTAQNCFNKITEVLKI